jgi:hypothetical protein
MGNRQFEGEYIHKYSNTMIGYVCRYHFALLGVVYEAEAKLDGKSKRLVQGVIGWGLGAIPPRRRLEASIRETIDIIDIEKLRAAINED